MSVEFLELQSVAIIAGSFIGTEQKSGLSPSQQCSD